MEGFSGVVLAGVLMIAAAFCIIAYIARMETTK